MKNFTGKTIDDAVKVAATELGVSENSLIFEVVDEKKGLFKKSATIAVYDRDDAIEYAQTYLKTAIKSLGIDITTSATTEDDVIKITIDSERNPVLIGRGGRTLQALNQLVKLAVSNKFRHRYRILLDVGGYKEEKYAKVEALAKREAKYVVKTKTDVRLDPMTPDERRAVHNALSGFEHIKTESDGEGKDRAVWIMYVE